jgi:hypothetical protein
MYKKSILSIAIASSLMLTGCFENNKLDDENEGVQTTPPISVTGGSAFPVFSPAASDFPLPTDVLFSTNTTGDGTFGVPDTTPPVTTALNQLSGASTVAPIDIKVSSGEVDVDTLAGNVYLLELHYASGSPVQGLSAQEPPTVVGAANVALEHIVLDGDSYIRINPKTPLKPLTRYEVVITNGVKDTLGQPLVRNPGVASYAALSDPSIPLANPQLAPLQGLINKLWEPIAVGFFDAVVNPARALANLDPLTESNIVLSYTLTTSGDEKVLEYIANPTEWFNDLITNFVGISTVKKVQATFGGDNPSPFDSNSNGKLDYAEISGLINSAITAFPNNPFDPTDTTISTALGPIEAAFPFIGCTDVTSGPSYISCIGTFFANMPSSQGGFADLLPKPKARTVTTLSANQPASLISAPLSNLITNPAQPPLVAQGTIDIPFYLGIPTGNTAAEGAVINSESWVADDALATRVNAVLQGLSPDAALAQGTARLADENGALTNETRDPTSSVVNYLFPFPKQSDADLADEAIDDLTIPWLAVTPHPAQAAQNQGTVIFQHGITTDRSAVLSVGTVLAQSGFTVIGIDQVAHGVSPKSTADRLALASQLLAAGQARGLPPFLAPSEVNNLAVLNKEIIRIAVENLAGVDEDTANVLLAAYLTNGTTGIPALDGGLAAMAPTLTAFENTVENAGSIIPGIAPTNNERHFSFTADAALAPTPMNFDPDNAFGSSGSLFINLLGFTNSRDKNRQGVIDLLNLRESLTDIDVNGAAPGGTLDGTNVFFSGHSLGTVVGIPFVTVANSSPVGDITAASFLEPASGITRMLENSPSFSPRILGGLAAKGITQGTSSFEKYMYGLQATLDSVDPINFADNLGGNATGSFQTNATAIGSLTILNAGTADENGATVYTADQTNIIEAETTQLGDASISYFAGVEKFADAVGTTDIIGSSTDNTPDHIRSRLAYGKHGMFVLPQTAQQTAAFREGMTQTTQFFLNSGESQVGSTSGLTNVADILIDDAAYNARPNKQLN